MALLAGLYVFEDFCVFSNNILCWAISETFDQTHRADTDTQLIHTMKIYRWNLQTHGKHMTYTNNTHSM